jgi:hypothetical protein
MSGSVEMETRSLSEYAREPAHLVELAKQATPKVVPAKNSAPGRSLESAHDVYEGNGPLAIRGLTHERCAELLGHHSSQGGRPGTPHVGGGA